MTDEQLEEIEKLFLNGLESRLLKEVKRLRSCQCVEVHQYDCPAGEQVKMLDIFCDKCKEQIPTGDSRGPCDPCHRKDSSK